MQLTPDAVLPHDHADAALVGRVWDPAVAGPSVVAVRGVEVIDLSGTFATMRSLTEAANPAAELRLADGPVLGTVPELLANSWQAQRHPDQPWLLSPVDVQVVKAAGVTFPVSMIERIIEERARGESDAAADIRAQVLTLLDGKVQNLVPGSAEAAELKQLLIERDLWSQYLEVGIGPDAEVFTKAPVLATVGVGAQIGIHPDSAWNNPEPEIVLAVSSSGTIVGATLGNDVNLRDIEGRSALLLPKAKDNNASAALGPFLRLFDDGYQLSDMASAVVDLRISGSEGFELQGSSPLSAISRSPQDLVAQVVGKHHQYPDGFVLYLGTLFAPVQDRDEPGQGFTHRIGDLVTISESRLGALINEVHYSHQIEPWSFGIDDLYRNLARRGLLH
ncbi:MAG: fumarylacetoacetate hydrolase family protein [Beutenbergiaceae bacterium]